ncbi:unnamed protein product [Ectocarpus sp. 12 AP-2014]
MIFSLKVARYSESPFPPPCHTQQTTRWVRAGAGRATTNNASDMEPELVQVGGPMKRDKNQSNPTRKETENKTHTRRDMAHISNPSTPLPCPKSVMSDQSPPIG